MPFVNFPIQCSTCRGLGKIKPISAFEMHQKALAIECQNCRGNGVIENKVYVNPVTQEKITGESSSLSTTIDELNSSEMGDVFLESSDKLVGEINAYVSDINKSKKSKKTGVENDTSY
jgi:hypothetical protein